MGVSKTTQYTKEVLEISKIANALAHPARIKIVETLKLNSGKRNIDFQALLGLSQTSVHVHLYKLKDAKIVEFKQFMNQYYVELNENNLEDLVHFLRRLTLVNSLI